MLRRLSLLAWIVSAWSGAPLAAQQAEGLPVEEPPLAALLRGDSFAIEVARRRLAPLQPGELPVPALVPLLSSTAGDAALEEGDRTESRVRRQAAAWLLAKCAAQLPERSGNDDSGPGPLGALPGQVADWARTEPDDEVLRPSLEFLPPDVLASLLTPEASPARLRALLLERYRRGGSSALADELRQSGLLRQTNLSALAAVAEIAVQFSSPLPVDEFAALDVERRSVVLAALARRPRPAASEWLQSLRAGLNGAVHPTQDHAPLTQSLDRLHVLLAVSAETWKAADHRFLVDGLLGDWPEAGDGGGRSSSQVADALDLLDSRARDRLVGAVHARILSGAEAAPLLRILDGMSPRGQQALAGIARGLPLPVAEELWAWLAERDSPAADELLARLFDQGGVDRPRLLRSSGPLLRGESETAATRREKVVARFGADGSADELRAAAFHALCDAGWPADGLYEFAIERTRAGGVEASERSVLRRVRQFAKLGPALPAADLTELLAAPESSVRDLAVRLVASTAADDPERDALLRRLITGADTPTRQQALLASLRYGPESLARLAWQQLEPGPRAMVAEDLQRRGTEWARELLAGLAADSPQVEEIQEALLRLGDRTVVDRLLVDPARFSDRFLTRTDTVVPALLTVDDGERVLDLIASSGGERRLAMLRWLVEQPALGGDDLLRELASEPLAAAEARDAEGDPFGGALEARFLAIRGVVARPALRAEMLQRLSAGLSRGFTAGERESALVILGGLPETGATADDGRFAVRLALVEPIADSRQDLLRTKPRASLPYANAMGRTLLSVRADQPVMPLVQAAVMEAVTTPGFELLRRDRIGRLITTTLREQALFDELAAPLAQLILGVPSLETDWRAVAEHLLTDWMAENGGVVGAIPLARSAAAHALASRLRPVQRRGIFGDHHPGGGERPAAWLAARPLLLEAERALARDASADEVGAILDRAAELGGAFGDGREDFRVRAALADLRTRAENR